MPIELKIFFTWAGLLFIIMFTGLSTIGNDPAQEILRPLALIWMLSGVVAGLFYMWRKL